MATVANAADWTASANSTICSLVAAVGLIAVLLPIDVDFAAVLIAATAVGLDLVAAVFDLMLAEAIPRLVLAEQATGRNLRQVDRDYFDFPFEKSVPVERCLHFAVRFLR